MRNYGWFRFTKASKNWRCARGQYCASGGLVPKGDWHASMVLQSKQRIGTSKVDQEYDPGELAEDGLRMPVYQTARLAMVRHLHLSCLTPWAEYECEVLESNPVRVGRPPGGAISLLSPAEQKRRRQLINRRTYLIKKAEKITDPILAVGMLREVAVDIRRELGKPSNVVGSRMASHARSLLCKGRTGGADPYCEPGIDYHCIHCRACFKKDCICLERKIRLAI